MHTICIEWIGFFTCWLKILDYDFGEFAVVIQIQLIADESHGYGSQSDLATQN